MNRAALSQLSKIELIDIMLAQARRIERLERRIAELEAKPGAPPEREHRACWAISGHDQPCRRL
jgi:BMFP domain-containing protein YqiC